MYYLLFTTSTCPKCPQFKQLVSEKVKFSGEILNEKSDSFYDLASSYGISSVPAFVVFENSQKEREIFRTSDGGELTEFLLKE